MPRRQQAKDIIYGIDHSLHETKSKALEWNRALPAHEVDQFYDV